jgi:hypothetical protein
VTGELFSFSVFYLLIQFIVQKPLPHRFHLPPRLPSLPGRAENAPTTSAAFGSGVARF